MVDVPFGADHLFDGSGFDGVGWVEAVAVMGVEFVAGFAGFVFEDVSFGEESAAARLRGEMCFLGSIEKTSLRGKG